MPKQHNEHVDKPTLEPQVPNPPCCLPTMNISFTCFFCIYLLLTCKQEEYLIRKDSQSGYLIRKSMAVGAGQMSSILSYVQQDPQLYSQLFSAMFSKGLNFFNCEVDCCEDQ